MGRLEHILLSTNASLHDVLKALDISAAGIIFIISDEGSIQGVLTDGDVRRAFLAGAEKTDLATKYMNSRFTAGSTQKSRQENIALLNDRIRHVPVLDENHRPIDILSWSDFWRIPVMEPSLGGNELKYITDCITSGWISSQGEYVSRFEEAFRTYIGVNHAISTTNGTTALHLALDALGVGPGDEVIVPDLTFGASANAVIHCGAKPVFVDVDRKTWTLDIQDVAAKITESTKAIMPVHIYGHPADMDPLMELAEQHRLYVIEDAAEAMGALYKGRKVGSIGHISAFSFFANKIITTGEGGMVTTNDPALYDKMVVMRAHGMRPERRYWHEYAGFNYRMTNMQAAIGLAQIERIEKFLAYREKIVARYNQHLSQLEGIILPPQAEWANNVFWLYSIVVDPARAHINRDVLRERLRVAGVETRPFFFPLHIQPAYHPYDQGESFPITTWLADNGLSLPTANNIQMEQIDFVCEAIANTLYQAQLQ